MRIGSKRISTEQTRLLRQTKTGDRDDIVRAVLQLLRDGDILHDREDVHPDWIEMYQSRADMLRRTLPSEIFKEVESFFQKLPTIDPQLEVLDLSELRTAFLLGAGASKPSPSNIPTVKELLPQLLDRGRRLDRDDVTKLADFCTERQIDNIEDLLTAAQLATFSSRNPNILRLQNFLLYGGDAEGLAGTSMAPPYLFDPETGRTIRRREATTANVSSVAFLQDTLQVLFGLLASTMLPAKPNKAHQAIAEFVKAHSNSTVITTNYDCCMDIALEDVKLPLTYCMEFSNLGKSKYGSEDNPARLIKLHGSLNWFYCETCQSVQCVEFRSTVQSYLEDKVPYSVIGICRECGGQRRGLLVPPLAMKFDVAPPLTPLLTEARDAFEEADAIVVVGFSFAEADIYISRMVSKSMQRKLAQRLIIIDPSFDVVQRVRKRFNSSIPRFDEKRIIGITASCAEALPKLLHGGFLKRTETSTDNGKVKADHEAGSKAEEPSKVSD